MAHRIQKFSSTLRQALGEILLYELNNPDFKNITISEVAVTPDLRIARVFVSSFNPKQDQVIEDLIKATGVIKQHLSKKMFLKYIPEIYFIRDEGFELDQKLSKFFKEKKNDQD